MASYSATVSSPRPPEEVFEYLADFRSVAEWDPSIDSSEHVNSDEPIAVGSLYRVTAGKVVIDYETTKLDRPHLIELHGSNDSIVSVDTITLEPRDDGGTDVTYEADIELKGARKIADPLAQLGLERLGSKARDGLEEKLQLAD